jgi:hypothetical protein
MVYALMNEFHGDIKILELVVLKTVCSLFSNGCRTVFLFKEHALWPLPLTLRVVPSTVPA